jgi:cyclohexadienyl dehydratase
MMRMATTLRLAVALSLLLVAPAAAEPVLRVGVSDDYPPFSSAGRGFDVEVANALARDFGFRIEWVRFRWPELREKVAAGAFDVAMSGITWRPERAVVGWMTRAVARGGPCVVGDTGAKRVGVNRGGVLETFARKRFSAAVIVAVDDNLSLPSRLEHGELGAAVTDSFELARFSPLGLPFRCEPPLDRKVYWVSPAKAAELGPRIDSWLARNEKQIDPLRVAWLGGSQPRDEIDHLVDLLARRLELMPAAAAWKRAHGRPIEAPQREAAVLAHAEASASAAALDPRTVRRFFELQIELAKTVERRSPPAAPTLDLESEIRPALGRIGEQIVASLAVAAPIDASMLFTDRLAPLAVLLEGVEMERLRGALLEIEPPHSKKAAGQSR